MICFGWLTIVFAIGSPSISYGWQRKSKLELLLKQIDEQQTEFAAEMEQIAAECESNSFLSDAARIRKRSRSHQLPSRELDSLPTSLLPPIPKNLDPIEYNWRVKLSHAEHEYAKDLYRFGRQAMHERQARLAFDLVRRAVYHDPDHEQGRKMLGFVKDGDTWTSPFLLKMRREKFVDHPEFGWLPEKHVLRYEAGERLFDGDWVTAEREQIERSDFSKAWEIKTEHFEIHTNYSLERGVELGRRLEKFHQFFIREFSAFFNTPQQMKNLFDNGRARSSSPEKRYRIHYYRNKGEFVRVLQASQPGIEQANGFYWPRQHTAYFFHVDDPEAADLNIETMYHEVTHQLLSESSRMLFDVGEQAHFWVIEGFACYLESFDVDDEGNVSVGDPAHPRIYWAKRKALEEEFYVRMQQFTLYGRREFMEEIDAETLHAHYSQATGICHFLLNYENGIYRDRFIDYLSQIYTPDSRIRYRTQTLDNVLGVSFDTLDRQYIEYLKSL